MAKGAGFEISGTEFLLVAGVAAALILGTGNLGSGLVAAPSQAIDDIGTPIGQGLGDILSAIGADLNIPGWFA